MNFNCLLFWFCTTVILQNNDCATDLYYNAGVVEYSPERFGADVEQDNLNNYVNIINSESAKNLDIIVFPELTLSVRNHKVPDPELKVIPCLSDEYSVQLHNISCAAREMKTYVLINVKEYVECTTEMIEEDLCNPKSNLNYYQYNTNVVFDRNGAVISRYRKFHLFGELYTDAPLQPEISIFETDFNVKFGHFTCFDLIFEEPTLSLMNNNVTDILFPSLWYSELPFLTAVQIQFYWAYRFNVNLLAAGANTPSVGSTGSGIYNGRNGALVHGMHFEDETKLYVAEVPKINSYEGSISLGKIRPHLFRSSDKDNLFMLRDFLGLYNSILLDYNRTTLTEEICYYSNCCTATIDWNIQENVLGIDSNIFYRYRLGIFNGVRTFSGYATGGIIACAIYACTNETIESCGTQFNSTTEETKYSVIFNSISIEAKLESGSGIYFLPNTLDNYLLPLPVTSIKYEESSDYKDLFGSIKRNIEISSTAPYANLLSFGIWGRNFNNDGKNISSEYTGSNFAYKTEYYYSLYGLGAFAVYKVFKILIFN